MRTRSSTPLQLHHAAQIAVSAALSYIAARSDDSHTALNWSAHTWLSETAAQAGLDSARLTSRKHYTIPSHPVASGAPFSLGILNECASRRATIRTRSRTGTSGPTRTRRPRIFRR